jgi:uncharacterized protein YciI
MGYFLLISAQGPTWVAGRTMREQAQWAEHCVWVNTAMYAGKVILGGPIGDGQTHRALLVVHFDSESEIRHWILEDPWIQSGVIRTESLEPWKLLVSNDKLDPILAEITHQGVAR